MRTQAHNRRAHERERKYCDKRSNRLWTRKTNGTSEQTKCHLPTKKNQKKFQIVYHFIAISYSAEHWDRNLVPRWDICTISIVHRMTIHDSHAFVCVRARLYVCVLCTNERGRKKYDKANWKKHTEYAIKLQILAHSSTATDRPTHTQPLVSAHSNRHAHTLSRHPCHWARIWKRAHMCLWPGSVCICVWATFLWINQ